MEIVMDLTLPSENKTQIYVSIAGCICIEQKNSIDDRMLVALSTKQAKAFLEALPGLIEEATLIIEDDGEVGDD